MSSTTRTPWTGIVKSASQLGRFGVVGIVALVVDVGLFNVLRFAGGEGPLFKWVLGAKVISSAVATIVSWLGNRYWTFRDTRRQQVRHEFVLFVIMCTIGLLISLACLALSHYVFGLTSPLDDNISANVIGLALGTAFRFYAYRRWVFTAPDVTGNLVDVQGVTIPADKAA